MIFIGADHGGFELKAVLVAHLKKKKKPITDLGPHEFDEADDYPVFAEKVARAVARKKGSKGILICRSSNGMAMAANKIHGIRAAIAWTPQIAKKSIEHNHANVLCVSGDEIALAANLKIVDAWLAAKPSKESRHARRVKQMMKLEK